MERNRDDGENRLNILDDLIKVYQLKNRDAMTFISDLAECKSDIERLEYIKANNIKFHIRNHNYGCAQRSWHEIIYYTYDTQPSGKAVNIRVFLRQTIVTIGLNGKDHHVSRDIQWISFTKGLSKGMNFILNELSHEGMRIAYGIPN